MTKTLKTNVWIDKILKDNKFEKDSLGDKAVTLLDTQYREFEFTKFQDFKDYIYQTEKDCFEDYNPREYDERTIEDEILMLQIVKECCRLINKVTDKEYNMDIDTLDDISEVAVGCWDFVGCNGAGEGVIKDAEGYKVVCSRGWIKLVPIDESEVIFD